MQDAIDRINTDISEIEMLGELMIDGLDDLKADAGCLTHSGTITDKGVAEQRVILKEVKIIKEQMRKVAERVRELRDMEILQ